MKMSLKSHSPGQSPTILLQKTRIQYYRSLSHMQLRNLMPWESSYHLATLEFTLVRYEILARSYG